MDKVPKAYLHWLAENVRLYGCLKFAVDTVLAGEELLDEEDAKVHRTMRRWTPDQGEVVVM